MKKCAVVIAAYNCPEYVIQAYNSVKNQKPFSGWEYDIRIGVDGCEKTSQALKNIKHYYSDENVGHLIMRNSIIGIEPADAYAYFDADDIMNENFLFECLKKIDEGEHLVIPAKIQCDVNLKPIKDNPVIQSGGAMVFTHAVIEAIGGFPPYRCAGDTDFMERAKMAGFKICEIQEALYQRRLHDNNLTRSGLTIYGGEYRKKAWQKMTEDREFGIIKIDPTVTPLKVIEMENISELPVYILIRTSNRPIFFKNMMESIIKQTYKNIITIVHTDNTNDKYVTGDIVIHGEKIISGTASYNLYCNTLLDSVPDIDGYYMFLDDDDMLFSDDAIEKFVSNCQKDKINVARVMRWNFEIFPKRWEQELSFQTECFMLHNSHRKLATWWDKRGGDHYYTRQITSILPINWIDDLIIAKAQDGKGNGECLDLGQRKNSENIPYKTRIRSNTSYRDMVHVIYLKTIVTPSILKGREGEIKMMELRRAEQLALKGKVKIIPPEKLEIIKASLEVTNG